MIMKLKHIFLLLSIIVVSSCDPSSWLENHKTKWFIKNMTDDAIEITCSQLKGQKKTILPKDSVLIYSFKHRVADSKLPSFSDLLKVDSIYVYAMDGDVIYSWIQDTLEPDCVNIYDESLWRHYTNNIGGPQYEFIWTFDIQRNR